MKKLQIALVAAATVVLTSFTTLSLWHSDPAHSDLGFSITHLGVSDVTGSFNSFKANIKSDKADFSDAVVEATIDVASIDTRVEARDQHLRSADFFDAEKYPQITFKSTAIKEVGKGQYKLSGNITAKGITKPVVLDLTYRGDVENPMSKKTTSGFKLSGRIKRSDFGIGISFPAPMLSDEVAIAINGEFNQ